MSAVPPLVAEVRREICARCDAPCAAFLEKKLAHDSAAAACPRSWPHAWGCYGDCVEAPAPRGLGDAVHAVAQPIARALDAVLGTKIQECGGCKARREALNRLMPDLGGRG